MRPSIHGGRHVVLKQTTYESLKTSCRKWHGELSQKLLGELVPIIYKGLKATA
jgi:hypothetical protein